MSEYRDRLIAELDNVDVEYEILNGAKHKLVEWFGLNGKRYKCQIDITAGDVRSCRNAVADLRRQLRDGGYDIEQRDVGEAKVYWSKDAFRASSLEVASRFGKAHKDVLRAFDNLSADLVADFTERNFAPSTYKDNSGRSLRCLEMTRDGFSLLVMGFTGKAAVEWKVRYLQAFSALESNAEKIAALERRLQAVEDDLRAATDLLMECKTQPAALPPPASPVIIRKGRFIRASVLRRMKKAARRAA